MKKRLEAQIIFSLIKNNVQVYTEMHGLIQKISIVQLDILLESSHPPLEHKKAEWNFR